MVNQPEFGRQATSVAGGVYQFSPEELELVARSISERIRKLLGLTKLKRGAPSNKVASIIIEEFTKAFRSAEGVQFASVTGAQSVDLQEAFFLGEDFRSGLSSDPETSSGFLKTGHADKLSGEISALRSDLLDRLVVISKRLDQLESRAEMDPARGHEQTGERSLSDEVDAAFDTAMVEDGVALESDIIARNIEMRRAYLDAIETLSSIEIHYRTGRTGNNPSEPASRWRKEKRVFGVKAGNAFRFPAFQFGSDGKPLPNVKAVLEALPDDMNDWDIALWFDSPNAYLDGRLPKDLLSEEETCKVLIEAARHEGLPMAG